MGKILIASGIGIDALKALNGAAAVAAGTGLVLAGSLIKSVFSGGGGGSGRARGGRDRFQGGGKAAFGRSQDAQKVQVGVDVGLSDAEFDTDWGRLRTGLQEEGRVKRRVAEQ
jgi:hypothetical protein